MPTIFIEPLVHRNADQIAVRFDYNDHIKDYIQKLAGIHWSKTHKVFYIKSTLENKRSLYDHLKDKGWKVDYNAYRKVKETASRVPRSKLTPEMQSFFDDFKNYLIGKRYSKNTIAVYAGFVYEFLVYQGNKPLRGLTNKDVELFITDIIIARSYAISTHRQMISALKQFTLFYPFTSINDLDSKRPKKSKHLPAVLSKEEVIDIIRCTKNLKHRAILALIYSCGLRIGELTGLKLSHIYVDRKQILIKNGKGRKDRYVVLADSYLPLLKNYFTTYMPKTYFVEGAKGRPYSESSIRKFLKRSCHASKISKHVTPHTLRHSYATHLLENGIGLRHIQELLGHSRPETTMLYTHIAKKDLMDIKSPLDMIVKSITKNQKREQNVLLSRNM
jgi:site-specific recombinase XerD